jgi:hypothetical protein
MASYATVDELRGYIDASGSVNWTAADSDNLELALDAASRWIDEKLDMQFVGTAGTRYYTADWHDLLYIDDLVSLTTLKTDDDADGVYETTWAATDYTLEPRNAAAKNRPYRQIRIKENGDYSFPTSVENGVEVAGSFGYAATVPAPIKQATLLLAHRLWMRKDAIFGVAGTPGLGVTVVQATITADADVMALLNGVDRRGF